MVVVVRVPLQLSSRLLPLTRLALGAGNIGPDDTPYADGGIHREGDPTATGEAYSAGVCFRIPFTVYIPHRAQKMRRKMAIEKCNVLTIR